MLPFQPSLLLPFSTSNVLNRACPPAVKSTSRVAHSKLPPPAPPHTQFSNAPPSPIIIILAGGTAHLPRVARGVTSAHPPLLLPRARSPPLRPRAAAPREWREWLPYRVVTVQSGYHTEWLPYRVATIQSGYHTEWLPCRVVTIQSGYHTEWGPREWRASPAFFQSSGAIARQPSVAWALSLRLLQRAQRPHLSVVSALTQPWSAPSPKRGQRLHPKRGQRPHFCLHRRAACPSAHTDARRAPVLTPTRGVPHTLPLRIGHPHASSRSTARSTACASARTRGRRRVGSRVTRARARCY